MSKPAARRLVIVGGGTSGWMAAAAFGKTIGRSARITLVESDAIGTIGVGEATIPIIDTFHRVLGLSPLDIVRHTQATFKLGIRFDDWQRIGASYFHPFGKYGVDHAGISFMRHWLRLNADNGLLDHGRFNLETMAARSGRFTLMPPTTADGPAINHAYQFDATLYAALLRDFAEAHGVERIEGRVVDVRQDAASGDVAAVTLEDGRAIEGDLFIDCSGFRALLIGETLKVGYDDWSKWLPCDRAWAVPSAPLNPIPPYTRASARSSGWQWRIPLQHRTGNGYVFSSAFQSEEAARAELLANLPSPPTAEPRLLRFTTGHRTVFWRNNVVAMGLAGGFIEPLESTAIYLVQAAIMKLMAFFPSDPISPNLVDRFNRAMADEYGFVRDFIVAHYTVTERDDTPFWRHCRTQDRPDRLVERLRLFADDGLVVDHPDDLFKEASWHAVLLGQGLRPARYPALAGMTPHSEAVALATRIRDAVDARVGSFPPHEAFLRSCLDPRAAAPAHRRERIFIR
ncbi:tryptophan halogenase family protein [Sphingomonas sp. Tas61C01]|uniref:tryptophan halogenase family protein n=1 Tax=Sphingomonas sp. Tas61C01 TaxID=3458297 RepID=UPI00403EDE9F